MNRDSEQSFIRNSLVLILAGGSARRFGSDKRKAIVESQETLLYKSISQFTAVGVRVLVCLSSRVEDDSLAEGLENRSIDCVRCKRSDEGMGGTLSESIAAVGDVSAVVIALADMPGLLPETILALLRHADRDQIVFPVFDSQRGHPVVFGGRFFPSLKSLSGDRGASKLLEEHADVCVPVKVDDPGVILDVDIPEDLQRLRLLLQRRSS